MTKTLFAAALLALCLPAQAVDISDCQDKMDRVHRASRDASVSISSPREAQDVGSILDELQTRIDRARKACQANTGATYCQQLRDIVVRGGQNEARQICRQHFEQVFCAVCLGS